MTRMFAKSIANGFKRTLDLVREFIKKELQ